MINDDTPPPLAVQTHSGPIRAAVSALRRLGGVGSLAALALVAALATLALTPWAGARPAGTTLRLAEAGPAHSVAEPSSAPAATVMPPSALGRGRDPDHAVSATPVRHPAPVVPPATKVITIREAVPAGPEAQAATDECKGPIEYDWPGIPPIITQHNYCGGYAMVNIRRGELVKIVGGTAPGTYTLASTHQILKGGTVGEFSASWGDIIVTTCDSATTEIALGLRKVA